MPHMPSANPASVRPRYALQEAGLVVVILLLGLLLTVRSGTTELLDSETGEPRTVNLFLNPQNLDKLAKDTSFFAIMAVGATLVIIIGGIDLSVGAIYALAGVAGAKWLHHYGPQGGGGDAGAAWVILSACAVCMGVATLCGLINGLLTVALRLHPFIITLGTMAVLRGAAFVWTQGQSIGFFPASFTDGFIRRQAVSGVYFVPMSAMLGVTLAGWLFLRHMVGGRYVFAVGGNETAARYSGVPVARTKVLVFALAGLTAGIAATIKLGYYGSASSVDGNGYELEVIAAAVVGGASLTGGKGTAAGALLGALLIRMIDMGIVVLNYDQAYSQIIMGVAIVAAAVLDRVSTGLSRRRSLGGA